MYDDVTSKSHWQQVAERIKQQKEAYRVNGKSVEKRVLEFAAFNYLMSFRNEDIRNDGSLPEPGEERSPVKPGKHKPKKKLETQAREDDELFLLELEAEAVIVALGLGIEIEV